MKRTNFCFFVLIGLFTHISKTQGDIYEKIFTSIYLGAQWGKNDEGVGFSGGGSTTKNTETYRAYLEKFIKDHNVTTVVDAGCGDWEFSRHINWDGIYYIGYDIVKHVIEKNEHLFGSQNIRFIHANLLNTDFPTADLLLCKHVLQHLNNDAIIDFLKQIKKFKYCLITNEVDPRTLSSSNPDIEIGGGQKIDLSMPPFNITGKKVLNYKIGSSIHQVFLIDNTEQD